MTVDETATAGRPRDPGVDSRILTAALQQFAAEGWKSFSIESVARRARVGKASIYLRWSSKEQILVEAFQAHAVRIEAPAAGHLREALLDLTLQLVEASAGHLGAANLRLRTDGDLPQELRRISALMARDAITSSTHLVKLGMATGEFPATVSPSLLMDCLAGAVTNRALASQFYEGDRPLKSRDDFARELVDFLLRP